VEADTKSWQQEVAKLADKLTEGEGRVKMVLHWTLEREVGPQ
jgi:hypothetical protein